MGLQLFIFQLIPQQFPIGRCVRIPMTDGLQIVIKMSSSVVALTHQKLNQTRNDFHT